MKMSALHSQRPLTTLIGFLVVTLCATSTMAGVEKVSNGVKFTYYDPDAGEVYVAGSFNSWNTTATAMTRDDDGNWSVVVTLGLGTHEYKFVVDGGWITDPDNPSTKGDGYGGVNSVVEVDSKGELVQTGDARPVSNTQLNPKIFIGGRYLSRTNVEKDVANDPRWRMQRPEQNVDFNFNVTISDLANGYARLRIDSGEKILQPNNISAFLDEAHITVTTDQFAVTGFHNEEVLRSDDPLAIIGDTDLTGTIFDDHTDDGKGQAGVLLTAHRWGVDLQGIISNVHDADIYNDPNLYDNTGTDMGFVRVSHERWQVTGGANAYMTRNLWWLNFTSHVGTVPANTGLPRLDDHIDTTGDPSEWFEFEDKIVAYGIDLSGEYYEGKLKPQLEVLRGTVSQKFVTSNNSGIDFGNGAIDVPVLDRDLRVYHGSIESTQIENVRLNVEHTHNETVNPNKDESYLAPLFMDDEIANKQILFAVGADPGTEKRRYTEFEASWTGVRYSALLWYQRGFLTVDPVVAGDMKLWAYDSSVSSRVTAKQSDRLALELEHQWRWQDAAVGAMAATTIDIFSVETILRGSYYIGRKVSGILDVRHLYFKDDLTDESDNFTVPFVGLQYDPVRKVSVLLAYGVDPLDFDIDYSGRHIGRERFRREYLWGSPGATWRDAEQALADKRMMSLRAIYKF
jgi:hypothetical protein